MIVCTTQIYFTYRSSRPGLQWNYDIRLSFMITVSSLLQILWKQSEVVQRRYKFKKGLKRYHFGVFLNLREHDEKNVFFREFAKRKKVPKWYFFNPFLHLYLGCICNLAKRPRIKILRLSNDFLDRNTPFYFNDSNFFRVE